MDYLQQLEWRNYLLQSKVRILNELKNYMESADSLELSLFAKDLASVFLPDGKSLHEVLFQILTTGNAPQGWKPFRYFPSGIVVPPPTGVTNRIPSSNVSIDTMPVETSKTKNEPLPENQTASPSIEESLTDKPQAAPDTSNELSIQAKEVEKENTRESKRKQDFLRVARQQGRSTIRIDSGVFFSLTSTAARGSC